MIVNIPLQIDEKSIEQVIQRDYEKRVADMLNELIIKTLIGIAKDHNRNYWKSDMTAQDGVKALTEAAIDNYVTTHTDEILTAAVDRLEYRLRNRKAIKAVAELKGGAE